MTRAQLTVSKVLLSITAGKMVMLRAEATYNSGIFYDTSRALSQEEHYRCNCCGAANAGEMPKSEQKYFMAFLDLEKQ